MDGVGNYVTREDYASRKGNRKLKQKQPWVKYKGWGWEGKKVIVKSWFPLGFLVLLMMMIQWFFTLRYQVRVS